MLNPKVLNEVFTCIMLRPQIPSCKRAKLHIVAASNKMEITRCDHSVAACSHQLHMDGILSAHTVRGESRMRRRSYRETSRTKKVASITIVLKIFTSWRKRLRNNQILIASDVKSSQPDSERPLAWNSKDWYILSYSVRTTSLVHTASERLCRSQCLSVVLGHNTTVLS